MTHLSMSERLAEGVILYLDSERGATLGSRGDLGESLHDEIPTERLWEIYRTIRRHLGRRIRDTTNPPDLVRLGQARMVHLQLDHRFGDPHHGANLIHLDRNGATITERLHDYQIKAMSDQLDHYLAARGSRGIL